MERKSRARKDSPDRSDPLSECEEHREDLLDEAIEESFPASDPPSPARPAGKDC